MSDWVVDASAVLALLMEEPGAARVREALHEPHMVSTVNLAEVATRLADGGMPDDVVASTIESLSLSIADFDKELAIRTGLLRPLTRARGLSLGDRACLALAERLGATALTADRQWRDLGVDVRIAFVR